MRERRPGFALEQDGKLIIAMPGPPREMTRMFELQVKPLLQKRQDSVIYYRMLRMFGIGESSLETVLLPLIDGQTDPTLATYAKEGECSLRIASKRATAEEARAAVDEMTEKVRAIVGAYIYSYDDEELIDVVGRLLLEKHITNRMRGILYRRTVCGRADRYGRHFRGLCARLCDLQRRGEGS